MPKIVRSKIVIKNSGYTFIFICTRDPKIREKIKLKLIAIECEKSFGNCYAPKHIYSSALRQGYAILKKQLKK